MPGGGVRPANQAVGSPAAWWVATKTRAATTNTKVVGTWRPAVPRAAATT